MVKKLKMTAAKAMTECIRREEVRKVFCVPGESFLPVLDALYDDQFIDLISARHEGGAAFMAEAYAKATGKPGVVFATRGPGAANVSIGVHTAYYDSTPMVVFIGQVSRKHRGREAFQEVDFDRFFRPVTKWTVEIREAERIPEIVTRAFRIARSGRPGPVVVSLPEDVLHEECIMQFGPKTTIPRPAPSLSEVRRIEQILSNAKRPLIIAGAGVKYAKAENILLEFAEKFRLPVMAAFRRHDVFPNQHPLYAGHLGLGTPDEIVNNAKEADVILAFGTQLSEITTQNYSILDLNKKLIHIDIDYETIGRVFPPDVGVVSDLNEALQLIININLKIRWKSWVKKLRSRFEKSVHLKITEKDPIYKKAIAILKEYLPDYSLITSDAGNFSGWLHRYYVFEEKHSYIGPASGAMGYGLPAAIGAKLALPNKTVVSLSGDGGFMMTAQEMETAVRYNIPVTAIVFNNQMYGTIRMHQEKHYPNRVIGTGLGFVSFKDMAIHMGAKAYQAGTADEFRNALTHAIAGNKPAVIEVPADQEHISVTDTITSLRKKVND